jgi:alpha-1,2-mannosyltransferase
MPRIERPVAGGTWWSALAAALIDDVKYATWLRRRRALVYASVLLAFEVAAFLLIAAVQRDVFFKLGRPTTTDFVSFYAAGTLADAGTPQLAYDQAAHYAAEERATAPGVIYNYFYYPPVFLLICAGLAMLPYLVAFVAFECASLLAYVLVIRTILRDRGWGALVAILAFPAVPWTLGTGQNGFLSASLFGGATLLIDSRPLWAGLLFGALAFKPHFGLLIPVALAAGGRWRAFLAAAATAACLALLSLALYGGETWHAFFAAVARSHITYESTHVDVGAMTNAFGAFRMWGASPSLAYGAQVVAVLVAASVVGFVWQRRLSLPLRAASLAGATLLAAPVALFYDFVVTFVAVAWLVRLGRGEGFLPWEKSTLVVVFIAPLATRYTGHVGVPVATLALVGLLLVVVNRARHELAQRAGAACRDDVGPMDGTAGSTIGLSDGT